jgi:hypothetical protein
MTNMQSATTTAGTVAPERESVLGVVGIAFGVVVIALAVGALVMLGRPSPPLEGEALLRERFARAGPFPYGLVVVGAERELDGREVVRLEGSRGVVAALAEGALGTERDAASEPSAAEAASAPPIDWDALPVVAGTDPARAALAWSPRERAERLLRDEFTALRFETREMGPGGGPGGGGGPGRGKPDEPPEAPPPKLQDGGTIHWAGYAAPYVRLREFELENGVPRFVESVRVNLTVGSRCCVLYLRWPHGEAGSREKTLEVLAALEPLAA